MAGKDPVKRGLNDVAYCDNALVNYVGYITRCLTELGSL